jgi:hypothetical protein
VRIVESTAPAWREGEGWRLSPETQLDLARAGDAPEHVFRDVVDAVRLHGGTLAVADASAREVRFFGADGTFLYRALGADGAPIALSVLGSLARASGDSVVAFDPEARRAFWIGPDGVVGRQQELRWEGGVGLDRAAVLQDGTIAVRTAWRTSEVPVESGVGRAPVRFVRFAGDGSLVDTIVSVPGPSVATLALGPARTFVPALLGAVTVHAVHGGRLYVGSGESPELRVHDADGALRQLIRVSGRDLSVTLEELDGARAERAATGRGNPVAERLMAQMERSLPPPASRPAYGGLVVDALGHVWLGEYPWLGAGGTPPRTPRVWTIFDPGGRMLGDVALPDGLRLLEVGADYLLALRWDGPAAQSVVLYGLSR